MRTAVADPLVGRVLENRYRLEDRLARGGMSTVYLARDLRLDRAVAVKVMAEQLSADPAFTDRFAREARAAARLAHLNVVGVYDQGDDAGHVFLVMELVRGSTVRDLVARRGALPLPLAVAVMEPLLAALAAAHRAGLVHRDVKPENVLVSDDGLVKVADFGLARAVEADAGSTRTNLMMGTVAYCSPEHVTSGRADTRSDVYSAGIVLFELLTGRVPYTGASPVQVAYQHVHSRVPAPSSRVRGIPEPIDDLLVRATDPDPAARPVDAGAFLAELHDLRAELHIPVVALPTGNGTGDDPGRPRPDSAPGTWRHDARTVAPAAPTAAPGRGSGARDARDVGADDPTGAFATTALAPPGRRGADHATTDLATTDLAGTDLAGTDPATSDVTTADLTTSHRPGAAASTGPTGPTGTGPATTTRTGAGPRPPVGTDWPARRRRRRRTAAVVVLVVLLVGAALGYGSWWYAAGRWAAVPDVVGRSTTDAASTLRAAGFGVDRAPDQAYSETVPAGRVLRTDPGPGGRKLHGATVGVTVSRGQERFTVPVTAGLAQTEADQALSTIPVTVRASTASSDTVGPGLAIGSDPPAGVQVRRGATVTLQVSSGPPLLPVPTVTGRSQADAAAALKAAGFGVAVGDPRFSDSVPAGQVIGQTPGAGTSAVKFSTVTVVVSRGPDVVAVPSVPTGTTLGAATTVMRNAGFVVQVDKQFGGLLGVVVRVDPSPGTTLHRGATVTLTVV